MNKYLFTEEYVGEENWKNRDSIVANYYKKVADPFVKENQSCGYSFSDFQFMLDEWVEE